MEARRIISANRYLIRIEQETDKKMYNNEKNVIKAPETWEKLNVPGLKTAASHKSPEDGERHTHSYRKSPGHP